MSRTRIAAITDSTYLSRALVMVDTLHAVEPSLHVDVLCMDARSRDVLAALGRQRVAAVDIGELEAFDRELASVRPSRTSAEYCWTVKPSFCRFLFDRNPDTEIVVYADADLMFFSSLAPLLGELGGSALVVPHRSPPDQRWEEAVGRFNAGFIAFRRSEETAALLEWWRERCLEWCFNRVEPGRSGDQKYLDEWPVRFPSVRMLTHVGGGLAPWNASRHQLCERDGEVYVDDAVRLVFFHYQSLQIFRGNASRLRRLGVLPSRYRLVPGSDLAWSMYASYDVSDAAEKLVYAPYVLRVAAASELLTRLGGAADGSVGTLDTRRVVRDVARSVAAVGPVRRAARRPRLRGQRA